MKLSLKSALKISILSALAIAPVLMSGNGASAQTVQTGKGLNESYIGAGVGTGITNPEGQDSKVGGNISARVTIPQSPVSIRGQVLYNDQTSAISPRLTYDLPVAKDTNVFFGGGYNFVQKDSPTYSPLGDKNAPVVTLGAERKLGDNIVLYGNADLGINAFEGNDRQAFSIQAGAGVNLR
ncbi:MAG TPA: hypothetical protein V6D15_22845 [Oculatellaceae cyanobacterium]|jgi:hypothetical protein